MSPDNAVPAAEQHQELLEAQTLVYYYTYGFIAPLSLKCAINLRLPDAVSRLSAESNGAAVTLSAVATNLPLLHPSKVRFLQRLMRLLVRLGVFTTAPTATGEPGYLPTPFSSLLNFEATNGNNHNRSMANYVVGTVDPIVLTPLFHLGEWLQEGESGPATAFETAHHMSVWECIGRDPDVAMRFNQVMSSDSEFAMELLVSQCADVFDGVGSLVDVGGGTGTAARTIKERFPGIRCTVLEMPDVVSKVQLEGTGGVDFVAGDMFEEIPQADAVFLKFVLHDWDDDKCINILKRCKDAIPSDCGKVLIFEIVMDKCTNGDPNLLDVKLFTDFMMMTSLGSMERNEEDWHRLITSAGFYRFEVKHELGLRCLMVAYP